MAHELQRDRAIDALSIAEGHLLSASAELEAAARYLKESTGVWYSTGLVLLAQCPLLDALASSANALCAELISRSNGPTNGDAQSDRT